MNMTIIVRISEDQYYDKSTGEHWRIMDFPQPVGISELDAAAAASLDNVVHNAFKKYEAHLASRAEAR